MLPNLRIFEQQELRKPGAGAVHPAVCTENLNPDVVMMKSAEDGV
jgi:hypothetical protein